MTLYDKKMQSLINSFGKDVSTLIKNKNAADKLEFIIQALKYNNIEASCFISTHSHHDEQFISSIILPNEPSDDDVIKMLHIVCSHIAAPLESVEIKTDDRHVSYGYRVKNHDGNEFTISLKDHAEIFTPAYLQHLLHVSQSSTPMYFGVDIGSNDQSVIAYLSLEATTGEVAA